MRFAILRDLREPGWIATEQAAKRIPCRGVGDTPSEALQDLLLLMWKQGNRDPEVRDMLNAENERAAFQQAVARNRT